MNILRWLKTSDIMDHEFVAVDEAEPLGELLELLAREPRTSYFVVDREGRYSGVIRQPDLQGILLQADALAPVIVARDLIREEVQALAPDDRLDSVMHIFAERQPDELPVVDAAGHPDLPALSTRHAPYGSGHSLPIRSTVPSAGSSFSRNTL